MASKSPRRQELLKAIGIRNFKTIPAECDETVPDGLTPEETVSYLAGKKAACVAEKEPDALIVAADTLVFLDGEPLGKPANAGDAARTLRRLSGRSHTVMTGIRVVFGGKEAGGCETTRVFFRELSDGEISAYVESGEPMDKAGSYGIQGLGAVLVERIEGDYFNVVGLPLCRLCRVMKELGINILG